MLKAADLVDKYGLPAIFFLSLLSATLLPGVSEVGLAALVISGRFRPVPLLLSATAGNWLGSVLTFFTGWAFGIERLAEWFGISADSVSGAAQWVADYGVWSGLLAWVPIIGDPIVAYLGIMHAPVLLTCLTILIGKVLRYSVIIGAALLGKKGYGAWFHRKNDDEGKTTSELKS